MEIRGRRTAMTRLIVLETVTSPADSFMTSIEFVLKSDKYNTSQLE